MNEHDDIEKDDRDDAFDAELDALVGELPRAIEPERDLWAGIEAAITEPQKPQLNWRMMVGQAAAVVLLVGASSGLTFMAVKDDGSSLPTEPPNMVPLNAEYASFGSQYSLGPDFRDARRDLEARLEREMEQLSPEARADVEASMQTIRDAIADINQALDAEPDNELLQELLLSTYREELHLMRKVNGITSTVMRRNDI